MFFALFFIVLGILYETGVIGHEKEYNKNSNGMYGGLFLLFPLLLLPALNKFFDIVKTNRLVITYTWLFSHIFCYFMLAFLSPGQWPFWLAIGILWEFFECYGPVCNKRLECNGLYDVLANTLGISLAMWIRSEIKISSLDK